MFNKFYRLFSGLVFNEHRSVRTQNHDPGKTS